MDERITLGSLFDGAGGFPHAGELAGIETRWASEIEPFPIRVTTRRFPAVKHLGNITEINGSEIEPVDIITFGSPCQDLSVAGNRKGLAGERSGLFLEAIRLIREMREKTNGRKPEFIVWENVPGAFTSNKGEDFRTVLEEIARIKCGGGIAVPRPSDGRWKHAGEILGDGYSIAWRTYDAQYWGVPQRRKRIYLVADFRGERAGKIQFESDRLRRDFETGKSQGEAAPGAAGGNPEAPGGGICLNDQGGSQMDISYGVAGTLRAESHGNNPIVTAFHLTQDVTNYEGKSPCISTGNPVHGQATIGVVLPKAYGLSSKASNAWQSSNPHSGCYEADTTRTLDTGGGDPTRNQGGMIVVYENHGQDNRYKELGKIGETVTAKYGTGGNNQPIVVQPSFSIGRDYTTTETEKAQTLTSSDTPQMVAVPYSIGNGQTHSLYLDEKARTLDTMHDPQAIIAPSPEPDPYIARRLTPLECCRLQGYPDGWAKDLDTADPTEEEIDFWAEVFETHRRATAPEKKPKTRNQIAKWLKNPQSDSAEYKMWGNSLAIPNAYQVLAGIAEAIKQPATESTKEGEDAERKESTGIRTETKRKQETKSIPPGQMTIWDFYPELAP